MIKIFITNERGNIELPKDELEKLLQEAYSEGATKQGVSIRPSINEVSKSKSITINPNPHITWTAITPSDTNTITTNTTQAINLPKEINDGTFKF